MVTTVDSLETGAAGAVSDAVMLTGVHKAFGATRALNGCNFNASLGEIHAVVGGNGSGKSTLAKVISGLLPADSGQVTVLGHTPTSPGEARAIGVTMVFQEVLVADACSIADNVFMGADGLFSRAMPRREKFAATRAVMEELSGLEIDPETPAGVLPLNLKQWIVIARALLVHPQVLILDESSAALDFDSTLRLFAKMRTLRDEGAAVIIVTHRIAELIQIADRATVLRDGRDCGVLAKKDITERNLLELMTGDSEAGGAKHAIVRPAGGAAVLRLDRMRLWPKSQEIAFDLRRGEIVGLAGLDGQGQSDFTRVLAGIDRAAEGVPEVLTHAGEYVPLDNADTAARLGVAYVSGDRKREGILPNLSIFENLVLPLYPKRAHGGPLAAVDWGALGGVFDTERDRLRIRMGDPADRIISLSGGNQQKVLIGRAFAQGPRILVLNDPARGVDIAAKSDLYEHLHAYAALGRSVVYMSSEIEEFPGLCARVLVFRNGAVFEEFAGEEIDPPQILHAMFGQRPGLGDREPAAHAVDGEERVDVPVVRPFALSSPAFVEGGRIPDRYAEQNQLSPPLAWTDPPPGTRSLALSVTDPDLPDEFNFPRSFAHWMVYNIPPETRGLAEGASPRGPLPRGARELNSDYVTFRISGFERGYGGPWPPDRAHRYVFTLYALTAPRLDLPGDATLVEFSAAVLPTTITATTLVGIYGPAHAPLPS